jgi:two-component system OmpR family sensor kinase
VKRSLFQQIFLWYALVVTAMILGVALVAHNVLVSTLRASIDARLAEQSESVAEAVLSKPVLDSEGYENLLDELTEEELPYVPAVVRLTDPEGNQLAIFGDIPATILPGMNELLQGVTSDGRFDTINIMGHEALRLYTVAITDASGQTLFLIQTGDSLAQIVAAQGRLWRYALAVGVVGLLVALLLGRLILQRGLRPLDSILRQLKDVRARNLNVKLPDEPRPVEIQQLADGLNSMLARLDTAFRARESFVASISHDLRTPLTALQGQIEVLAMEPTLTVENKESLGKMVREIRRLIRMSNNLLLNIQLESKPPLSVGKVNLTELVEEVTRETQVLANGLEIRVSTPGVLVVPGDYDLLKQMLLNIVDNAIKFTPKGGSIDITLNHDEQHAIVSVSDTGQGISKEHLAHITEPFYKAEAAGKPTGGAGLGLAIVKQIISLHKGEIDIQSQPKAGTTVTMRLPLPKYGSTRS